MFVEVVAHFPVVLSSASDECPAEAADIDIELAPSQQYDVERSAKELRTQLNMGRKSWRDVPRLDFNMDVSIENAENATMAEDLVFHQVVAALNANRPVVLTGVPLMA